MTRHHQGPVGMIAATSPLGLATAALLAEQGFEIRAGHRNKELIPAQWRDRPKTRTIRVELLDDAPAFSDFNECASVIWLAHVRRGDPDETDRNVGIFRAFLGSMGNSRRRRIVLISSGGSVYGHSDSPTISESHPRNPISPYGRAKLQMENALLDWGLRTGRSTAIIRPANIYGPESIQGRSKGVVGAVLRNLSANTTFSLLGDAEAVRDYVHIDDVARAIVLALDSTRPSLIWNVGSGVGRSVRQVIELAESITGSPLRGETKRLPNRPTDVRSNVLSIERIAADCGWRPTVEFEAGMRKLLAESREPLCSEAGLSPETK